MSRIFDALQRSEGERPREDSATLPEGQELLREAERRAASDWAITTSAKEDDAVRPVERKINPAFGYGSNVVASATLPINENALTTDERIEILNRFQSLSISVRQESRLVCLTDHESPTAEAVRLLAVRLKDIRRTRSLKTVLVTSTIPREGKSMVAANLAFALARRGEEKVLLIEGDLRLPAVMEMLGVEQKPGLSEYLHDERSLWESIFSAGENCPWILPGGNTPSNPLELLQSQKLPFLMGKLSTYFDWIIVDSPPVLPLADTSIWMRLADGVLLVTRRRVTEKKQLMKGLEALEPGKVLGALLNSSKASPYSSYYYCGHSSS